MPRGKVTTPKKASASRVNLEKARRRYRAQIRLRHWCIRAAGVALDEGRYDDCVRLSRRSLDL